MSATSIPLAFESTELATTCLWPWLENPYRLISLLSMLTFDAGRFATVIAGLQNIASGFDHQTPAVRATEKLFNGSAASNDLLDQIKYSVQYCREAGFPMAAIPLQRIVDMASVITVGALCALLKDGIQRMRDEASALRFYRVDVEKVKFLSESAPLMGDDVFSNFPSANDDVAEAGKCLALGRSTASVFHLMRTIEAGLKVVARELGIPYAPSWESYIKQIKTQIETDWKQKPPEWKSEEAFYKDVLGDLQSIKLAWRNPTMHIVKHYSPDQAMIVFDAVRQFMIRLALKPLSE